MKILLSIWLKDFVMSLHHSIPFFDTFIIEVSITCSVQLSIYANRICNNDIYTSDIHIKCTHIIDILISGIYTISIYNNGIMYTNNIIWITSSATITNLPMPYSPFAIAIWNSTPTHSTCQKTPFWLIFSKGNISWCVGCGQCNIQKTDGSVPEPSDDICLQHKEHVVFENPHTGCHQISSDFLK